MKTSWTALLPQNQIGAKCDLEWYASPQFLNVLLVFNAKQFAIIFQRSRHCRGRVADG